MNTGLEANIQKHNSLNGLSKDVLGKRWDLRYN